MEFRFKALQKMREPDELDTVTRLAEPRGWIAVFVVMIVMIGFAGWAFFGTLPRSISAPGLLTYPLGVAPLQSIYTGMVKDVRVAPADDVIAGQAVADLTDAAGRSRQIISPFAGQVVGVSVGAGEVVSAGQTVLTVQRTGGRDKSLVAMLFMSSTDALSIVPGEPVGLSVSTEPAAAFGVLRGRVRSVSAYPLTVQALTGLLGDQVTASRFTAGGLPRLVIVDLVPDATTRSGYAWSTTQGPPDMLRSQVAVTGSVSLGGQKPISFILGR